ncbi:hypothetical protein LPJ68_005591 [Coemansia sp. RSA 1086]|nr:hypothetical protein LPJ68_005591 [Coemansia sp. RSA 1086]
MIPDESTGTVHSEVAVSGIKTSFAADTGIPVSQSAPTATSDHLTALSAEAAAATKANSGVQLQQAQDASQLLQNTLSGTNSGVGLAPSLAHPEASTADLAKGFEMASLSTPIVASPPINSDSAAASALATVAVPTQLQHHQLQPLDSSASSLHMNRTLNTSVVTSQPETAIASGLHLPGAPAGTDAPITDSASIVQQIANAAAQLSPSSYEQSTQPSLALQQAAMADAVTSSMLSGTGNLMLAPMLTTAPNTAGVPVAQFPTTPATTPGTQTIQAQQQQFSPADILMQQQIALAAAISSSANANIQLNAGMQTEHPHSLAAAAPVMMSGASAHSRSTSIVDGAVAMYPRDGSNNAAAHNGISAGGIPNSLAGQQDKAHDMPTSHDIKMPPGFVSISQHQQHQQPLSSVLSANASTVASANPSGVPSPYATPAATTANNAMAGGHRRHLSSTFPAAMHQQQQQLSQAMMCMDTPASVVTESQTLVPGTPTAFGQLQYPLNASGSGTYHGHSRHLSLDMANFRLASADCSSLHGLPLQETIHEHPAEMTSALQFETAQSIALVQQQLQQLHQMQAQAHAQMQEKASALAVRTVPATPQGMHQGSALSDSLAQHQLQSRLSQHQRTMGFHHGSSSVDLGSLSSPFGLVQFNNALSEQMSPAAIHPSMATMAGMAQLHLPQQPPQLSSSATMTSSAAAAISQPASAAVEATTNFEDFDEEDEEDDDNGSPESDAKGPKKAKSGNSSKPKKAKAPYKRFRNSFIFFANERRKQWRLEHPDVPKIQNRGFIQEMSKVWNAMSSEEKAPYIQMADEDKRRYEEDVKKYGPLPVSSNKDMGADNTPNVDELPSGMIQATTPASDTIMAPASLAEITLAPAITEAALANITAAVDPSLLSMQPNAAAPSVASAAGLTVSPASQAMAVEPFEFDAGNFSQKAYQALLRQALGQDFSPQAVEFDSSCFVNAESMAVDEPACANSAVLSTSVPPAQGILPATSDNKTVSLPSTNGPPITTQVGTKRKSGSDGQPMTSLPTSIKRFRNSFIYFVNERRREIQYTPDGTPTNVEVNNREFLKEMSTKWRSMTEEEKAPYLKMADIDKERFTRQMREYELEHPDEFNRNVKHRRRQSSTGINTASSAEAASKLHEQRMAAQQQQQQQQQLISSGSEPAALCGLNISLNAGNASGSSEKADLSTASVAHVPSLPSVPEEAAACSQPMEICSNVSLAGSIAPTATAAMATLPADASNENKQM